MAGQVALSFSSVSVAGDPSANFGWTFSLSAAVTVTALGDYEVRGGSPAEVGIWDASGNLLASATVSASDPVTDGFNFVAIGPVTLPAGSGYTIGGWFQPTPGGPIGFSATGLTTIPELTYTGGAMQANGASGFQQPVGDAYGYDPGYFGPDFEVLCLLAGTRVLTLAGEAAVETLRPGDLVITVSGLPRPIRWIGCGRTLVTPRNRDRATPVVVRRHALAEGVPHRDLYITRGHALYLEGVLIPVEELINHRSIAWDEAARVVEYYHVELDSHDVIFAERAAVESYREAANAAQFHNAATRPAAASEAYAPVLHEDPRVKRIWRKLSERAGRLDLAFTADPDLHLRADGVRLLPEAMQGPVWRFRLAGPVGELRIVSRSAIPAMIGLEQDQRRLGVALRRIVLRRPGLTLAVGWDEPLLVRGFHGPEPAQRHRWTDGEAVLPPELLLPFGAGCTVELHVAGLLPYPLLPEPAALAQAA